MFVDNHHTFQIHFEHSPRQSIYVIFMSPHQLCVFVFSLSFQSWNCLWDNWLPKWKWASAIICFNIGDNTHVFCIWMSITHLSLHCRLCMSCTISSSTQRFHLNKWVYFEQGKNWHDQLGKLWIFGILDPTGPSCSKYIW